MHARELTLTESLLAQEIQRLPRAPGARNQRHVANAGVQEARDRLVIAPVLCGDDDVVVRVHGELAVVKIIGQHASGVRKTRRIRHRIGMIDATIGAGHGARRE